MLRLLGFFGLTFVLFLVLTRLPFVGRLAGGAPLLGFFAAAALVSFALTKWGEAALGMRRARALVRELGAVDTPYNKGKLGSLFLVQGRFARAVPLFEEACAGEPRSAEWHFKRGRALLGARRPADAVLAFERARELDEEHPKGGAAMRLAEARLASGDTQGSLEALDRVERNHGESPESAYRRGRALRALGRKDEAQRSFARVAELAGESVGYQKRTATRWTARAVLARLF